jgi:hypothetical protein
MDYLNQKHSAFKESPEAHEFAVRTLLDLALRLSHSFNMQFDRERLQRVIGAGFMEKLLPELRDSRVTGRRGSGGYEVHEEQLDAVKARILRGILSGELEGWEDLPLNYIESATLRDRDGRIVLRISDMGEEIILSLPEPERSVLIERFAGEGIPEEVIEQVAVNEDKLHP